MIITVVVVVALIYSAREATRVMARGRVANKVTSREASYNVKLMI